MDTLVKPVVDSLYGEEDLLQTAGLASVIASPQEAGDQRFDMYFDRTFWLCAYRLAEMPTKSAELALASLRQHFAYDGHGSEEMKDLMRKQKIIQEK